MVHRPNLYYSNIYQKRIFNFLWNSKIYNLPKAWFTFPFRESGLGILDIETQLNALKIKWIQRLLNPNNAVWKNLMLYQFNFKSELFIVYIGVSTSPVKNTTPLFLTKLPLNLKTVQALFFGQYPPYILVFCETPL